MDSINQFINTKQVQVMKFFNQISSFPNYKINEKAETTKKKKTQIANTLAEWAGIPPVIIEEDLPSSPREGRSMETLINKWIIPYHSKLEEKLQSSDIKTLKQVIELASKLNLGNETPPKEVTKISKLLHAVTGESEKSNKKEMDTKKKSKLERSEKSLRATKQQISRLEDFENPSTYEWLAQFASKGPDEKRAREYIVLLLAETERLKQELTQQLSRSRANSSFDTWSDGSFTMSRGETPPLSNSSSSDQVSNRSNCSSLSTSLNSVPPIKKLQISQSEDLDDRSKEKKQKKKKRKQELAENYLLRILLEVEVVQYLLQ